MTSSAATAADGLPRSGEARSLGRGRIDWTDDGEQLSVTVTRQDTYPVVIGRGRLDTLPALVGRTLRTDSVFVVTDDTVAGLFLARVTGAFAAAGLPVQSVVVAAGEPSKSWPAAQSVIEALLARAPSAARAGGARRRRDHRHGRLRGVRLHARPAVRQRPTSLIAQLDAAIGGKTGIDYDGSKNLLGAFYHPAAVLIDPDLLATLPPREVRSGLAEAVKVGMLHPPLFAKLEKLRPDPGQTCWPASPGTRCSARCGCCRTTRSSSPWSGCSTSATPSGTRWRRPPPSRGTGTARRSRSASRWPP